MARTHKDVEFHIEAGTRGTVVFTDWDKACGLAVSIAASGKTAVIDVVIWSKAGARAWGGDEGVEQYDEDPDASVFERIEIEANPAGRVP